MPEESKLAEKLENATKFSEEELKTVKEIQDEYISLGRKAADYGESAIDWLNKNVLSGGNFGLKNPTPKLP